MKLFRLLHVIIGVKDHQVKEPSHQSCKNGKTQKENRHNFLSVIGLVLYHRNLIEKVLL